MGHAGVEGSTITDLASGRCLSSQDLNPYAEETQGRTQRRGRVTPHESYVSEFVDFKNVTFLEQFLSPAGKLLPRCAHVASAEDTTLPS